mmetsp:Transcript_6626/g.9931  ORF Transcript_6626/g.9931 Transcript_6626/m.9931 type:complete len:107 (-) Transcript_6626:418-738(-)
MTPAVAPNNVLPQPPVAITSSYSAPKTKKKNRALKFLRNCGKDFCSGMAGDNEHAGVGDYSDVGLGPSRAKSTAPKTKKKNRRTKEQVAKDARRSQGFSMYADCGL